eukprot:TRINITY_DN6238_c0_g2_i1.p1 TRINITY_DN6238_c0_g2~~TRINITY_DN6238_c0_g2_i1.p1  ORF type:complete len:623 (+),score=139.96 TRINITY_DN6238_c0_g2_i1:110-1870(+)
MAEASARGGGRLRRALYLAAAACLAGAPPVVVWYLEMSEDGCIFWCDNEGWSAPDPVMEGCLPQLTYAYEALDLPNGSALHVFTRRRLAGTRMLPGTEAVPNVTCVPDSDRHCGFSHAFFHRALTEYKRPNNTISLPHGVGGVPATFVKYDTLHVHLPAHDNHPAVRVISAVATYSLIRKHKATVRHLNSSSDCSVTLEAALLYPLSVHPAWQEKNLAHFIGDVWHWLFQLSRLYPLRAPNPLPVILFPAKSTAVASVYSTRHGFPSLVPDVAPGLIASGDLKPHTCVKRLYADCPSPSTLRPMGDFQRFLGEKYGWSFRPRRCYLGGGCRANLTLALRRPNGTRAIANPREVLEEGRLAGLCTRVVRFEKLSLRQVAEALQETDVLLAVHGAEHAAMSFMRRGSVVIEVVPQWYADGDAFYMAQSDAGGISLLRWRLAGDKHVAYHNGAGFPLPCKWFTTVAKWGIFQHRSLPSLFYFPKAELRRVIDTALLLLPWAPPREPCPQPVPVVKEDAQCFKWWWRSLKCNSAITDMVFPDSSGRASGRGRGGLGPGGFRSPYSAGSRRWRDFWSDMERRSRAGQRKPR